MRPAKPREDDDVEAPVSAPLGRVGRAWLRFTLGEQGAERALGDLEDRYARTAGLRGRGAARRACRREALLLSTWALWDAVRKRFERRPAGRSRMLNGLGQDVRFAVRGLSRRPGFTFIAVLVLALGIGANVAIFTLADRLFVRTPPLLEQPDRLVRVFRSWGVQNAGGSLAYPDYLDYRDGATTVSGLAAACSCTIVATANIDGASATAQVQTITANWFDVLGIRPAAGRFFRAEENETVGGSPVAVVSWGFWRNEMGGGSAVDRDILLNGNRFTVVGVVPRGYHGLGPGEPVPDVFIPILMRDAVAPSSDSAWRERLPDTRDRWISVVGRLRPGVAVAATQSELAAIARRIRTIDGGEPTESVLVTPQFRWLPSMAARLETLTRVLMLAVSLLLVCAAANVAILLIARASAREREIGIRAALGAAKGRVARLLLTESLLLGTAGFALGLVLAVGAARVAGALLPFSVDVPLTPDARMVAIALGVSLVTALAVGLAPAWRAARSDVVGLIQGRDHAAGGTRLRDALVVLQIALSVVLVAGAALFTRSLVSARSTDTGFDESGLLLVTVDLGNHGYDAERGRAFLDDALRRLSDLPGVDVASSMRKVPFTGDWSTDLTPWSGSTFPDGRTEVTVGLNSVSPGYFDAMRVPIVRGRGIEEGDRNGSDLVVVVNETLARALFGTTAVVGRDIPFGDNAFRIVGVAADAKYYAIDEEPWTQAYVSHQQAYSRYITFVVRTQGNPAPLSQPMQETLHAIDPSIAFSSVETMEAIFGRQIARYRASAHVVGLTGLIALILASAGLYGVMAYRVSQRTRELGLRMALGAQRSSLAGWVLSGGLRLAIAGVALGLVASFGLGRFVEGLLFSVDARDPVALTVAPLVLLAVAIIATLVPARRAMRVDPIRAMRSD